MCATVSSMSVCMDNVFCSFPYLLWKSSKFIKAAFSDAIFCFSSVRESPNTHLSRLLCPNRNTIPPTVQPFLNCLPTKQQTTAENSVDFRRYFPLNIFWVSGTNLSISSSLTRATSSGTQFNRFGKTAKLYSENPHWNMNVKLACTRQYRCIVAIYSLVGYNTSTSTRHSSRFA